MTPPEFRLKDFDAVKSEIERLRAGGHVRRGNWDFAQVCDHLTYFIDASLDGAKFRVPWLIKVLFGRMALKRTLATRRIKPGSPTPHQLPPPGGDESAAAERLTRAIERLQAHAGAFHPSPFFGAMTREQCLEMHLIHCNHHLGMLTAKVSL